MSAVTLEQLLGEDVDDVYGVRPDAGIVFQPQTQIGDGLGGPENVQPLFIYRDTRPLAVDELGMGHLGKLARHRAGRTFPLNLSFGAGYDDTLPGLPLGEGQTPSVISPGGLPAAHAGIPAPEVVAQPRTIMYTATRDVGWTGW